MEKKGKVEKCSGKVQNSQRDKLHAEYPEGHSNERQGECELTGQYAITYERKDTHDEEWHKKDGPCRSQCAAGRQDYVPYVASFHYKDISG